MQTTHAVASEVFRLFDFVTIIASVASLVLAIVAIWLAVLFNREAHQLNSATSLLLEEIRAETKLISKGIMEELQRYGESMRGTFVRNQTTETSGTVDVSPDTDIRT